MKSELSAVSRRDTNKLNASAVQQQHFVERLANKADASISKIAKSCKKASKAKCKQSISPNLKGFKKIPKIQLRCSTTLTVLNQSLLDDEPSNDSAEFVGDVSRIVIGDGKPRRITKLRSNQMRSPCSSNSPMKISKKGRGIVKRSPLRSPHYSPMKDAFERHRRDTAAFMKLKSSEKFYLKVMV